MSGEGETESLLNLISKTEPEKLGNWLAEIQKYTELIDQISGLLTRLNRIGVLPAVLRIIGVKMGIPEINAPLKDPLGISAVSALHKVLFEELNKQPEELIKALMNQAIVQIKEPIKKDE